MAFWLAAKREGQESDWIQRFDPRYWTVNFPRPMMAAVVSTAHDALRVDATFYSKGDLGGLIWDTVDSLDHPLLAYTTDRDYSRTTLKFRWRSAGIIPLDQQNGPTLTIEGKDASGAPHAWYVRLWNYAMGTPSDAVITLKFSELDGGYTLPLEADRVYPKQIERLFISMVAPGYVFNDTSAFSAPIEGWIELSDIQCTGHRSLVEIGDVIVPPHGLAIATGYDDNGTQTPARILRNIRQLGYRGSVVHYVGMSHYFRMAASGSGFLVGGTGDPLCTPARAWHLAFLQECKRTGFSPILSLSYEVLAQHCPDAWQQRAYNGDPSRTGWDPPSALLSPAKAEAMAWLQSVAAAFVGLMKQAAVPVRFQVGEPWWWITSDGRIHIYDAAAKAALGGNPVEIPSLKQPLNAAQKALLDAAGAILASSTASLVQAARNAAAPQSAEALLLVFPPTLLSPDMPDARRASLPVGWASPAFDRLQVEDYDWLTTGADGYRRAAYQVINDRLGYPPAQQDYFAGFVLTPQQSGEWRQIDAGIDEAKTRAPHEIFVWALPQVTRDGYLRLPEPKESDTMQAFDDVLFPLALGLDAAISPEFSTSISVTASGFERRNSVWSDARLRFDVGPGVRSESELGTLIAFFRARRGAARGFRLRDPSDYSSNGMVGTPTAADQLLGTSNGQQSAFALVKRYGTGNAVQVRRVTRPRVGTVLVSVGGTAVTSGWTVGAGGMVNFAVPPASGAAVRAGFLFDVPVRFAEDKLDLTGATFIAGDAPSVPVVEVREAL